MNLDDYIQAVKITTDPEVLKRDLHIDDNFLVLFYGNAAEIYNNLVEDFRNSPRLYLMNRGWNLFSCVPPKYHHYKSVEDGLDVQILNDVYGTYIEAIDTKIDDRDHVAHLVFHAKFVDRVGTVDPALKPTVLNFLEYAKMHRYTFCLPYFDEPIIWQPQAVVPKPERR